MQLWVCTAGLRSAAMLTLHDQNVAGVAISLEKSPIQQLPPIRLCNPVQYLVHSHLALPLGQALHLVAQARDLGTVQEVHDQQLPRDQPRDTAWDLYLLREPLVLLHRHTF